MANIKYGKKIIQGVKGMHDILPPDQPLWLKLRDLARDIAESYNFDRIDTPLLESAELFERPLGAASDVVTKQMFIIKTKSGDRLALRPEGTAGIMRSYLEHGLSHLAQPLKLYYEGPMFRYEQPQAGRYRQFHQVGFEIVGGEDDSVYDAQIMLVCSRLLGAMKIKDIQIHVNSIGCRVCRPIYRRKLIDYYKGKQKLLCSDCQNRLNLNPLRLLDCKKENCRELRQGVPILVDSLCATCKKLLRLVLEYLEELNLPYELDHYLVRGFDYYSRTVFEIYVAGFDTAVAAGGRYDYLAELIGGRPIAGTGGAIGLERAVEIIKARNLKLAYKLKPKIFLAHVGDLAKKKSLSISEQIRSAGIGITELLGKESLRAQFKAADKIGAPLILILGQQEVFDESIIIRDMKTGAQETVSLKNLTTILKRRLKA